LKIDAKFFGAILFLVAQTSGAIWWASSLSSEVERLAGIQGTSIPALEEAIEGLDVMGFRVEQLSKELEKINDRNDAIENQHSRLFEALQGNQIQQSSKGYGGYD
tara:strand:+ start:910 stop:1224 length:315 start_codon:yes stop_codon:yes gene_type:complete